MNTPQDHRATESANCSISPRLTRCAGLTVLCAYLAVTPYYLAGAPGAAFAGKRDLKVLTRNLYIGANLEPLMGASDISEIPLLVAQTAGKIMATDFPARAAALADEIVSQQPDLVGLQEVTLLRLQTPGDYLLGNPLPASQPALDYLQILQMQLAARGASYAVAAIVTNWDVELPMVVPTDTGFRLDDLRATDFDVILIKTDLPPGHLRVLNHDQGNFVTTLEISVAGVPLSFPRGWCLVDLQVRGRNLRVINTHLESFYSLVRAAQALELVAGPADVSEPVVCIGDFNSDPSFPAPEAYGVMVAAGFTDAWAAVHPGDPGYTWGQAEDLLNPVSTLSERDDHVWFRGGSLSTYRVVLTGDDPADRVPSLVDPSMLLWPSDHAGVSAVLRMK